MITVTALPERGEIDVAIDELSVTFLAAPPKCGRDKSSIKRAMNWIVEPAAVTSAIP